MSEISDLQEEVSHDGDFKIRSEFARNQGWEAGRPMTIEQARRFSNAVEHRMCSSQFSSDEEAFEIAEQIEEDWPSVEVRFGGSFERGGYIDAMYVLYEDVDDYDEFEEYAALHLKSSMDGGPEYNCGIDPESDPRITLTNEHFRYPEDDDNLWATASEFDFREHPGYNKVLRVWWDD